MQRVVHGGFRLLSGLLSVIWRPVLWIGLVGWGLGTLADGLASFTGDQQAALLWQRIATTVGYSPAHVRIALFLPAQIAVAVMLRAPWLRLRQPLARVGSRAIALFNRLPSAIRRTATLSAVALTFLAMVPLVVQPTLVPLRSDRTTWVTRTANLVDGTALTTVVDASVNVYLRWQARPIPGLYSVQPAALRRHSLDGELMARWDPLLREATRDRTHFAQTKAFMWVESAGRQYAVSTTGCAGLMQFCVSTAQRRPFRKIFGVGQVSTCNCKGRPCALPRSLRDALETDSLALERHPAAFPCNPTDARFDGRKAIHAGAAFTTELGEDVGNNLYLMYIGYNSGPAVAKRLWARVGKNPHADLDDIRPHLAPVLRRWYGDRATPRANGLLDVHLPKLRKAYEHYR